METVRTMMRRFLVIFTWMMFFFLEMVVRNHLVRAVNGNGRSWIVAASQNIPGTLAPINKQLVIDDLLRTKKPHLLAVIEPRYTQMMTFQFDGYKLVKGTCSGVDDPRINLLVKDGVQFLADLYRKWKL